MTPIGLLLISHLWAATLLPADGVVPAVQGRDIEVLGAVLDHLLTREDFGLARSSEGRTRIVLVPSVPEGQGVLARRLVDQTLQQGHTIPDSAVWDLQQRNASEPLFHLRWQFEGDGSLPPSILLVEDFTAQLEAAIDPSISELSFFFLGSSESFKKAFPEARAWIQPYFPGYSEDGTVAVVRARAGPSPHGELITALLEHRHGFWELLWCDVFYIV